MMPGQRQYADISYVSPVSSSIMLIGILSIVVAAITILLALGGGFFVGLWATLATSLTPTTWTLTPTGSYFGSTAFIDTSADADEVEYMIDGMLAKQTVGDVQEKHLRRILRAHGRSAFPNAQNAEDVSGAIQQAAPDGTGGIYYALSSAGRFNVDADGADWLDPLGARFYSGDVLDEPEESRDVYGSLDWQVDDLMLDAAVMRINDELPTPLSPDEAELVRTHLGDRNAMPLGWVDDAAYLDEQLLSARRDENNALVVELDGGTYTLPAGSRDATYVAHNGMPNAARMASGGWLTALGALGAACGSGVLLAAGIQTLRLRPSAVWLHWLAVAALLASSAVVVMGCAILSGALSDASPVVGLIGGGAAMALPTLYALFLIGALLLSPLRHL